MSLERLDRIVYEEKNKVETYKKRSDQRIYDNVVSTAKKLKLYQVLKILPYDTLNTVLEKSENNTLPILEFYKTDILSYNHGYKYGDEIIFDYSRFVISLSPEKITVTFYAVPLEKTEKTFTSLPIINKTYKHMACKIEEALKSFKIKKELEEANNRNKFPDDLPF